MQTGKILGIGAVLSAGLLAANIASASTLTLEEYAAGGTGSSPSYGTTTLYSSGSGTYTTGGGSYGTLNWGGVTATVSQTAHGASLELAISGLTDAYGEWGFLVSDTSFPSLGSGASLVGVASYSLSSGGTKGNTDSFSMAGYADPGNHLFGVPSGAGFPSNVYVSSSAYKVNPVTFGPSSQKTSITATTSPISLPSAYSLSTEGIINTTGSGGGPYNVDFTTSVAGTSSAVRLPGSGPLTVVGGLVLVGGLAIRRRMKA